MRTYTATTTSIAGPAAVLAVLTDPDAVARWAPVDFYVDDLTHPRLSEGSRARVSGRLAGQRVGFDVEVHEADEAGLALSADGPVALDVALRAARGRRRRQRGLGLRRRAAAARPARPPARRGDGRRAGERRAAGRARPDRGRSRAA